MDFGAFSRAVFMAYEILMKEISEQIILDEFLPIVRNI